MKIVFLSFPHTHPVHLEWAKSVADEIILLKAFDSPILSTLSNFFVLPKIPKADVYLTENLLQATWLQITGRKRFYNSKVITINADPFFYNPSKIRLQLVKYVDGIISCSYYIQNLAKKFTKVPNEVVYPFANTEKFLPLNPDLDSHNIIFVSNLVPQRRIWEKGVDLLLQAFRLIKKRYPDANLYLVGKGTDQFAGKDGVYGLGFLNDFRDVLERCSIYVNSARIEPFGVNIIEAMCAGLVPVISEGCGAKEVVSEVNSSLVTNDIARRVIEIFKLPRSQKKKISEKAKEIGSRFTRSRSVNEFKQAFSRIIEKVLKDANR